MIHIVVSNQLETQQYDHPRGPVELGRGPKRGAIPRIIVRDGFVSRDHVRVEELPNGKLLVENLSLKGAIALDGDSLLPPASKAEYFLPLRLMIGESTVDVEAEEADLIEAEQLRTINMPKRSSESSASNLLALGKTPSVEEITSWLETVVAVQKAATGSPEFYQQTAQAIVEQVGLDNALIILRSGESWQVVANVTNNERQTGRAYSYTILKKVVEERRTFYQASATAGSATESLMGVRSVVASPFFHSKTNEVLGVIYGTRFLNAKAKAFGPLEAKIVQLLASAVGAGLARQEQDAEANRLRVSKEAAEAADQAKSQFLAMISHELRTPLTTIIGYSEMILEQPDTDTLGDYAPDVKKIHTAGQHLLALINDILDLSKIEAQRMEIAKEPYEPASLIRDTAVSVEPLVKKNRNRIVIECPTSMPQGIGDPTRLRQCMLNLLGNACKFTNDGQVTVRAQLVGAAGNEMLTVAVTDSGIGMNDEQVSRLFQPFSQVDPSAARKHEGTGLGLAITRKLCQAMGGDVSVVSKPGQGSTFTMRVALDVSRTPPDQHSKATAVYS